MKIIKRSGEEVLFDLSKIIQAITKARNATVGSQLSDSAIESLANKITYQLETFTHAPHVEEIQDLVVTTLIKEDYIQEGFNYINYRHKHELIRKANSTDEQILSLVRRNNEEIKQENSNKNPIINSVQRDYMAGEVSKDISRRILLPEHIIAAHDAGIIHFHDMDYFIQPMHNCCLVNLEDMLNNGTVISETKIEPPHSFSTACTIATQIIAQVASCQYGGQTISLAHLAPFVQKSRESFEKLLLPTKAVDEELYHKQVEDMVKYDIKRGVQTIQYQIITLMTTNGQAPFVSIGMYLNEAKDERTKEDLAMIMEEVMNQRYQGVKNCTGNWITPAFPKLLYITQEDNIHPGSKYYYLTELAAKCSAKRMVPDYISEKIMMESKIDDNGEGQCYPCMGCRSFLTPYLDENGQPKYYGRFNQGVVTLNLVDIACSSGKDPQKFWKIMNERLDLCFEALMYRHNRLKGTPSDVAPILWQYGALARLKPGELIDPLLYNNYSTLSLGYAGLYECVKYMTGVSHTDPLGTEFGKRIMDRLNAACAGWRAQTTIGFSLYGTPMESTTYKFARKLQERFGIIPGITDKNYITNSYHIHVTEPIDAFSKLTFESKFQKLSPGGAISYVEVPNLENNLPAVLSLVSHIHENIMYAELNTKSDFCQKCGYSGEIQLVPDENGKLIWKCPNCGNTDQSSMNVARRTCGYIGTQAFNQGRLGEIADRVLHL